MINNIIDSINKNYGTIKITTLNKARSCDLKRFFSGSFCIDQITGGGYAYRRMHLIYGGKSSGKNAILYQTIAYNQRLCRNCGQLLPEFADNVSNDRHANILMNVCGIGVCQCNNPVGKIVCIFDYERSLSREVPKVKYVSKYVNKKTNAEIDESEYNLLLQKLESLSGEDDSEEKKKIEQFLSNIEVIECLVDMLPTEDYLNKCGILVDRLLVADPEYTEEGIDMIIPLVKDRGADIIIWDSLQAAIPLRVMERDADQATMGIEAKQNGLLMRQICAAFAAKNLEDPFESYKPAIFIISQVRASLGGFVSGMDTFSGGKAVEHHISLALELKREYFLKEDGSKAEFKDDVYGQKIRIRAEKNKLSVPGSLYELDYYFRENNLHQIGIDNFSELIFLAIRNNVITRAGSYYLYNGMKFHGLNKLYDYFSENGVGSYRELYKLIFMR